MAILTTSEAIVRFDQNEDRINKFVNEYGTYAPNSGLPVVETLPSFIQRSNNALNLLTATNVKGAWTASTVYTTWDEVQYSGTWYRCVVAHTSTSTFDSAKWRLSQGATLGQLSSSGGSDLITYKNSRSGSVNRTVTSRLDDVINVKDFGALGNGGDDTSAIELAISACLVAGLGYTTLFFPYGTYGVSRPLHLPANYRLEGDNAVVKALNGFVGKTVTKASGGTIVLDSVLLFLLGNYEDISGAQRNNAFVGRGITVDCNEQSSSGVFIERMPYSNIECRVINTKAGGSGIEIGTYCWGTHLDGVVIENFSENAVTIGVGSNGITITSPRIWGNTKTGVSGIFIRPSANVNGVAILGGFIEKVAYGMSVSRGNGAISVNGTDFEVCTINCVAINGSSADSFQSTLSLNNCYLDATGAKVSATYGKVDVNGCRLRSGSDFTTGGGGFISARNNTYESGVPSISAGANVAVDIEQTWTPILLDDSLNPSEGQTVTSSTGTFSRVGNRIYFKGFIQMSSLGGLTTAQTARLGGLPFTSSSASNTQSSISVGYATGLALSGVSSLSGYVGVGVNYITLQKFSSTSGTQNLTVGEISSSGSIMFSGSYSV